VSEVVGEDRPASRDLLALIAHQPAAAQAVAALEVADASFGASAVALQAALGALGAGLLSACDEHALGSEVFELPARRGRGEGAVQRDLLVREPELRSSTVAGRSWFSTGLPIRVDARTIRPRAPG
jgi:hypothetical protein